MKKHHGAVFSELTYSMLQKNNKETNIANMNQKLQDEGMGGWQVSPNFTGKDNSTFVNDEACYSRHHSSRLWFEQRALSRIHPSS